MWARTLISTSLINLIFVPDCPSITIQSWLGAMKSFKSVIFSAPEKFAIIGYDLVERCLNLHVVQLNNLEYIYS